MFRFDNSAMRILSPSFRLSSAFTYKLHPRFEITLIFLSKERSHTSFLAAQSRRRRTKRVVGTYVKIHLFAHLALYLQDLPSFSARRRTHTIAMTATHLSPVSAFVFLGRLKGIPHFRMINHDFARWRRAHRRSECIVQCTGRRVLLDHECFTTITPGRCWVCCCV